MKIKISLNFYLIFLSLILAWSTWICYALPIPDTVKVNDVTNVMIIAFFLLVLLCENMISSIPLNKQFVFFVLIVVTSSAAAYVLFKQPVLKGIIVLRDTYIQYSLAVSLYYLIKSGKMKRKQLYYTVIMAIRIAVTVYVVFYLLHTYAEIDILQITSEHQRYGSSRYYFNLEMPIFLICNAFSNLYSEKMKAVDYYDILAVLYLVLIVTKMRYAALCCVCGIMIGLLAAKKFGLKKIFLIAGAGCAGMVLLFFTDMGQDFLNMLSGGDFFSTNTETIRKIGRLKHLLSFLKSPVFGLGYPHEECYAAMYEFGALNKYNITGRLESIYMSDNGIFDLLYIFGLSGIAWVIFYFGGWLKKSIRFMKKGGSSVYFMYMVMQILGMYTGCGWLFHGMIFIGIFDALIRSASEEPEESEEM